jgi:hypothetical protein
MFGINLANSEMAAEVARALIMMTKCYLRQKAGTNWEIVYPQTTDSADETYYDNSKDASANGEMVFYEYMEKVGLTIPNRIVVYGNNPDNLLPWPTDMITGDTGAPGGVYPEILEPYLVRTITDQTDITNRANALLARISAEAVAGRVIVPHDCRVELCDRVAVVDSRVGTSTLTLRPNAAGDEENITDATSGAGNHWQDVDDVTSDESASTVNTIADAWERDLYNLPALGIDGAISKIVVYARVCGYITPNQSNAKIAIKTGGIAYEGSEITSTGGNDAGVPNNFTTYSEEWTVNPGTGVAWTVDEIDALQIGISLRNSVSSGTARTYCTQVYIVVYIASYSYPTKDLARVSVLTHRYNRYTGEYNLIIELGGITNDCWTTGPAFRQETASPVTGEDNMLPEEAAAPEERLGVPGMVYTGPTIAPPSPTIPPSLPTMPSLPTIPPSLWQQITPWKEERGETLLSELKEIKERITPWKEEKGETLLGEIKERWRAITPWREERGETFPTAIGGIIKQTKEFLQRQSEVTEARKNWWEFWK